MASCVFYGITCLIRLIELATLFATFEERVCYTSSVRQVVPPGLLRLLDRLLAEEAEVILGRSRTNGVNTNGKWCRCNNN